MTDGPDTPSTPARDDQDNAEFSDDSAAAKGGYPEESPEEVKPDADPKQGREEQPQRDPG